VLVHRVDGLLRRPVQQGAAERNVDPVAIFRQIKRWDDVIMHVDQPPARGRAHGYSGSGQSDSREAGEKLRRCMASGGAAGWSQQRQLRKS